MRIFGPSQWEVKALIIISRQLQTINHKLDVLIAANPAVDQAKLNELAAKLESSTGDLAHAIEKYEKGT